MSTPYFDQKQNREITPEAKERWARIARETLERLDAPAVLKEEIAASLDTPQYGHYHNEGLRMDAHVGLILENIASILDGTFDFVSLNIPADVADRITRSVTQHVSEMEAYDLLHDVKKAACMNVEYGAEENEGGTGKKRQEVFTLAQWDEIVNACDGDEVRIRQALKDKGIIKIGYRLDAKLTPQGEGDREHGEYAETFLRVLAERDADVARFVDRHERVIRGVENHEMHFQVFSAATSAKQYDERLAKVFGQEDIDFILAVCFLDISGSLNEDGASDYSGFFRMLESEQAYLTVTRYIEERERQGKPLRSEQVGELMLAKPADISAKIYAIEHPPLKNLTADRIATVRSRITDEILAQFAIDPARRGEIDAALASQDWGRSLAELKLFKLKKFIEDVLAGRA